MYCPKCSQQQPSEDMRYCSRCGLALGQVSKLLANNGVIHGPTGELSPSRSPSRSRMMMESVALTLAAWAIALLATLVFDYGGPIELVAKIGALIFFVAGLMGLIKFLYALLIAKEANESASSDRPPVFPLASRRAALPSEHSTKVSDFQRPSNTKEMLPQRSVTENTTRLLDEDQLE